MDFFSGAHAGFGTPGSVSPGASVRKTRARSTVVIFNDLRQSGRPVSGVGRAGRVESKVWSNHFEATPSDPSWKLHPKWAPEAPARKAQPKWAQPKWTSGNVGGTAKRGRALPKQFDEQQKCSEPKSWGRPHVHPLKAFS